MTASAPSVNRAVSKGRSARWKFLCQGPEPDPDPADSSCLSNHDFLRAASGLVTVQVPILPAKPQLLFVYLSQEAVALYFEGVCILFAQLKISEEAAPEEDQ